MTKPDDPLPIAGLPEWANKNLNYPRTVLAILSLFPMEVRLGASLEILQKVDMEVSRAVEERRQQIAHALDKLIAEGEYSSAQVNAIRDAANEVWRLVLFRVEAQTVREG